MTNPGDPNAAVAGTSYFCRIPVPSNLNTVDAVYLYEMYQYFDISLRPEGISNGYLYFVAARALADFLAELTMAGGDEQIWHIEPCPEPPPEANLASASDV